MWNAFLNCFSSTVVSISPPNPSHPHSPPLILPPSGFVYVSFIHVPQNPAPFTLVIFSHLPSGYCQFVLHFNVSGYVLFVCLLLECIDFSLCLLFSGHECGLRLSPLIRHCRNLQCYPVLCPLFQPLHVSWYLSKKFGGGGGGGLDIGPSQE